MRALILGGGAARGAFEAGVAQALCEREDFDIVCGTSIGAVNGALVAQGDAARLRETWATMSARDITKLRPELAVAEALGRHLAGLGRGSLGARLTHARDALASLPKIGRLAGIAKAKGLFDRRNIRDAVASGAVFAALRRTFIASVTNLSTGSAESFAFFPDGAAASAATFYASEGDARPMTAENYIDAICASAALPPAFEPVDIRCEDGVVRTFADGAYTNNTPIRQAIDAGATEITLVMLSHPGLRSKDHTVRSLGHVVAITLEASTERMLELDLKLARRINDQVYRGFGDGKRFVDIRVIAPSVPLSLNGMAFNNQIAIDRVFAQGYVDGSHAVDRLAPRAG